MCLGINRFALAVQFSSCPLFTQELQLLPNLHERRKFQKINERKNQYFGYSSFWEFIFLLPTDSPTSSILDFVKGEPEAPTESFDLEGFSRIPVLRGGRVKPIDSVARNTLLVLRNKRTALDGDGNKVPAINWFAEVLFNPEAGDNLKTFLVDHDQVLGLLGKSFPLTVNSFHTKNWNHSSAKLIPVPARQEKLSRKKEIVSIKILSTFTARYFFTAN